MLRRYHPVDNESICIHGTLYVVYLYSSLNQQAHQILRKEHAKWKWKWKWTSTNRVRLPIPYRLTVMCLWQQDPWWNLWPVGPDNASRARITYLWTLRTAICRAKAMCLPSLQLVPPAHSLRSQKDGQLENLGEYTTDN